MTAVKIQSNKIVPNEVKDNLSTMRAILRKLPNKPFVVFNPILQTWQLKITEICFMRVLEARNLELNSLINFCILHTLKDDLEMSYDMDLDSSIFE